MIDFPQFLSRLIKRYDRLFISIAVIFVCYLIYAFYRFEIFVWFCEQEKNAPACTQVGLLALDRSDDRLSKYYLNQSCQMGYGLGCFRLSEVYRRQGDALQEQQFLQKACQLQFPLACDQIKK